MTENSFDTERRKFPRVFISASGVVATDEGSQRLHSVENLSAGGALLVGDFPLPLGRVITVLLVISERPSIHIKANVVRAVEQLSGLWQIGLEFIHESTDTEDLIQDMVLAELERDEEPQRDLL